MEQLPPWVQAILSIGVFVVAAFAYAKGAFSASAKPSKDLVVNSVTIADGVALRDLAEQLRDQNRNSGTIASNLQEMIFELHRLNEQVEMIRSAASRIESLGQVRRDG